MNCLEGQIRKVVIVDDVDFMRNVLKSILASEQCEIVGEAAEGKELFGILESKKVDCVFLDINMPGINGMDVLRRIKYDYPHIKVVMCSAISKEEVRQQAISLGAAGYITKPFLPATISAILHMIK